MPREEIDIFWENMTLELIYLHFISCSLRRFRLIKNLSFNTLCYWTCCIYSTSINQRVALKWCSSLVIPSKWLQLTLLLCNHISFFLLFHAVICNLNWDLILHKNICQSLCNHEICQLSVILMLWSRSSRGSTSPSIWWHRHPASCWRLLFVHVLISYHDTALIGFLLLGFLVI